MNSVEIERLRVHLPEGLTRKNRFVCFVFKQRGNGKQGKVPVDPHTGQPVNHRDPRHHLPFEQVLEAASVARISGIGYVLDIGEVLVDLDDCLVAGKLNALARSYVAEARTYAEISVSGMGCKLLLEGQKPGPACRKGKVEVYGPGFFTALTGRRITPFGVEGRQDWLAEMYAANFEKRPSPTSKSEEILLTLEDAEVLSRARRARNGVAFIRLFDQGVIADYPSASEADYALVNHLRFWTGGCPKQIDRLYRRSALMREKWDRAVGRSTYGERTIQRALAGGGTVLSSSSVTNSHHWTQSENSFRD